MSLYGDRVMNAIKRLGQTVTVEGSPQTAVLRPLAIGQLQTYVSSGTFASWERPVYGGIFPADADLTPEDDFQGPDFSGQIRQVSAIRVLGVLVAKHAVIEKVSPPPTP